MRNIHLDRLLMDATEVKQASEALFASLSSEQLTWKPDKKTWSILECFDHLYTTNGLYLPRIRQAIETAENSGQNGVRPFKPSYFARLFMRSLKPGAGIKLKTFKAFKPQHGPQALDVTTSFLTRQGELIELIKRADGCDVNSVKFSSPISPLIRFSIGEGLSVLVIHEQRHLLQAQNIQLHASFPEFQHVKRA